MALTSVGGSTNSLMRVDTMELKYKNLPNKRRKIDRSKNNSTVHPLHGRIVCQKVFSAVVQIHTLMLNHFAKEVCESK